MSPGKVGYLLVDSREKEEEDRLCFSYRTASVNLILKVSEQKRLSIIHLNFYNGT